MKIFPLNRVGISVREHDHDSTLQGHGTLFTAFRPAVTGPVNMFLLRLSGRANFFQERFRCELLY